MNEQDVRRIIREEIAVKSFSDRIVFQRTLEMSDGLSLMFGGNNGTKIGTSALQKIGFLGATPLAQWSSGTGRGDVSSESGLAALRSTQYTGNTGATGYSVGDIVAALKSYGLLHA